MAGHIVTDVKGFIYDAIYRGIPFDMGTTLEVGLSTTSPDEDGSNFTEPSGMGYARVSRAATDWTPPNSLGEGANSTAITFPVATGEWGIITYAGVFEITPEIHDRRKAFLADKPISTTVTNIELIPIAFYELSEAIYVSSGIVVEFNVNDFIFGPWALP